MTEINYKAFFDVAKDGIVFEAPFGRLTSYELFNLELDSLLELYKALKAKLAEFSVLEEDDILTNNDSKERKILETKVDVIRGVIIYKRALAEREKLRQKKAQLKKMLEEIKLRQLQEDPSKVEEELEKISELLDEQG